MDSLSDFSSFCQVCHEFGEPPIRHQRPLVFYSSTACPCCIYGSFDGFVFVEPLHWNCCWRFCCPCGSFRRSTSIHSRTRSHRAFDTKNRLVDFHTVSGLVFAVLSEFWAVSCLLGHTARTREPKERSERHVGVLFAGRRVRLQDIVAMVS